MIYFGASGWFLYVMLKRISFKSIAYSLHSFGPLFALSDAYIAQIKLRNVEESRDILSIFPRLGSASAVVP